MVCLMFYRIPQNRLDDPQQQQPGARKKYDKKRRNQEGQTVRGIKKCRKRQKS